MYLLELQCHQITLYVTSQLTYKKFYLIVYQQQKTVKNNFQLVNKLSNVHIKNKFQLISLDVISLFTNIPIEEAVDCISNRWDISQNCGIEKKEFMLAIKFVLKSTFFKFNNKMYERTYGTPMGSSLFPIIADIFLQDLEKKALNSLTFKPSFYFRYVDNVIMTIPSDFQFILPLDTIQC